jgi:hypothetical protein
VISVVALCWLIAPIAGVFLLFNHLATKDLVAVQPVWATATVAEGEAHEPVALALAWTDGKAVVAPDWSGTVLSVTTTPGQAVASGDIVAKVDGVSRMAAALAVPLYRELQPGMTGEDVRSLVAFLKSRGAALPDTDRVSAQVWRAVTGLARELGVDTRNGLASFDPAWLIFLPASPVTVSEVLLSPGSPAPPAGERVLNLARTLDSARIITPAVAARVTADSPLTEAEVEAASVAVQGGASMFVGNTEVAIAEDRVSVASDSLPTIAALVADDAAATAARIVAPQQSGVRVPVSAVLSDTAGTCVILRDATGERPLPATTRQSVDGSSLLDIDLPRGAEVMVNPAALGKSCAPS